MARRKDANSIIETEITDSRLAREFVELSRELDETVPDKPAKILISSVTPRINRKASELKERYKRKREFIAMLLAYILAVPFILMLMLTAQGSLNNNVKRIAEIQQKYILRINNPYHALAITRNDTINYQKTFKMVLNIYSVCSKILFAFSMDNGV
jgi:hypothetical protein